MIVFHLYTNRLISKPSNAPVSLAIRSYISVCLPGIKYCSNSVAIATTETIVNTITKIFTERICRNPSFLIAAVSNIDKSKNNTKCTSLSLTLNATSGKFFTGVKVPNRIAINQPEAAIEKYGSFLTNQLLICSGIQKVFNF